MKTGLSEKIPVALICLMAAVAPFVFYVGPGSFMVPRVMVIALCVWSACFIAIVSPPVKKSAVGWPLLVFAAAYLIAVPFSAQPAACLKTAYMFTTFIALAWVVSVYITTGARLRILCGIIVVAGFVMSVHGIFQYFFIDFSILRGIRFRVFATAGAPSVLSAWLAACLCLTLTFVITVRSRLVAVLLSIAWTVTLACLVMTYSRGGLLAGVIGLMITEASIIFLSGMGAKQALKRTALCAVVMLSLIVIAGSAYAVITGAGFSSKDAKTKKVLNEKVFVVDKDRKTVSVTEVKGNSSLLRVFTLKSALIMFARHPVLGIGPGMFAVESPAVQAELLKDPQMRKVYVEVASGRHATHVHNEYIELLLDCGLIGLAAFLLLLIMAARSIFGAIRAREDESLRRAMLCGVSGGIIVMLAQCLIEFPLHDALEAMMFWTLLGAGCGAAAKSWTEQPSTSPVSSVARADALVISIVMLFLAPLPYMAIKSMQLADIYLRVRQDVEAIRLLDRAVALDPLEPVILMDRATYYARKGDLDAAVSDMHRAERFSKSTELRNKFGYIYLITGKPVDAERELKIGLQIDPMRSVLWNNLAMSYFLQGRKADARVAAVKAESLIPHIRLVREMLDKEEAEAKRKK